MNMNTVLIADDDENLRKLLQRGLTDEQTEVLGAPDGSALLKTAYARVPDLIILDVSMPGANGIDICVALRQEPATRNVPIMMVTGSDQEFGEAECLEAGADAYMAKPFDFGLLKSLIDDLLQLGRAGA